MTEVMTELEEEHLSTEIRNLKLSSETYSSARASQIPAPISTFRRKSPVDLSKAAAFVNARVLPDFIGKRVRAVFQVTGSHSSNCVTAKFIDGSQLTLTLTGKIPQVPPPPMTYVEVFGIAETINSISVVMWAADIDAEFDVEYYNRFVELANGEYKSAFL